MVSILLTLALLQDGSARALADSVTEQDSAAAFRAISDLVDLADSRREEVEKEAARLPEFYRKVLLSELKARRELGERFGRGVRIDVKGTSRDFWDYMDEIGRHPGMSVETHAYQREHFAKSPMDVDLKDVWPLQALVLLCDRSNQRVSGPWQGKMSIRGRGHPTFPYKPPPWFFYRNIAVPQPAPRWRKLVDFSASPRWRAIFRISPILGPETQVAMWKDLSVLEATRDDGSELKVAASEDTAIPGHEWRSPSGAPEPMEFALDAGERKGTIRKLRCSVTARVPREWRRFRLEKLDGPEGGRVEDEDFEFTIRDSSPEDLGYVGPYATMWIRPKKTAHADLKGVPVTLILTWDTKINAPYSWTFHFTGEDEATTARMHWMGTLRPRPDGNGGQIRRLLAVEALIPMGLQDRPIFMEFRDIPLK